MLPQSRRLRGLPDIKFRVITEWLPSLSWAGCIMNIDWKRFQPENQAAYANGPNDILTEDSQLRSLPEAGRDQREQLQNHQNHG